MNSFSKTVYCILLFALLASSQTFAQQRNNFPQGSTAGTTEQNTNVRNPQVPNVNIQITQPQTGREVAFSVRLLALLTVLTLAPSLLILLTCFLRFSIVLDFIKRALSLQQVPPTAVLNGIAFFMTLFAMWPTFTNINRFPTAKSALKKRTDRRSPPHVFLCIRRWLATRHISLHL